MQPVYVSHVITPTCTLSNIALIHGIIKENMYVHAQMDATQAV